jgi:hypothetical protein
VRNSWCQLDHDKGDPMTYFGPTGCAAMSATPVKTAARAG